MPLKPGGSDGIHSLEDMSLILTDFYSVVKLTWVLISVKKQPI
jgi:hypothetical protein